MSPLSFFPPGQRNAPSSALCVKIAPDDLRDARISGAWTFVSLNHRRKSKNEAEIFLMLSGRGVEDFSDAG